MRIGGIASGMDTEQMVKDLMRAERVRVDKYFRQEESLKWKREALNTTNKTLAEFILKARSDFGLSRTTSTGTIVRSSTQSFDWVKKVSSSDESALKVTATASAMEGSHKIKVEQLAEVATITSKDIKDIVKEDGSFDLIKLGIDATTPFKTLIINGQTFNIGIREANGDYEGDIKSIDGLVSAINNAKDGDTSLGLRAAYDKTVGRLMINTKEMGLDKKINISGDTATDIFGTNTFDEGENAIVNLNGQTINDLKSNNISIFGINLQLQAADATKEIALNVESNVDGIMDKVKGFVEDYNALIDNLNGQLKQKSYRDFTPLTSEEKEAMTEKEIELWEEKAKSGLLRNDDTITRVLQTMRDGLYGNVNSGGSEIDPGTTLQGFYHITQIGITTGNYQSGGKLEINEDKLRAAINENPDGVVNLLFKTSDIKVTDGDATSAANKRANTGLVERLFDDMIGGMKEIVRRSGTGEDASLFRNVRSNMLIDFVTSGSISVMDRDIMNIGSRISNEERILAGREDRYWRQFTAMEKAMEQMNQQSGWLASQLGQMG